MHQQRVLEALGVWDDMVAQKLPVGHDVYAESDEWGEGINCVLGTYPLTDPVWIHRIKSAMKEAFLKKPAAECAARNVAAALRAHSYSSWRSHRMTRFHPHDDVIPPP